MPEKKPDVYKTIFLIMTLVVLFVLYYAVNSFLTLPTPFTYTFSNPSTTIPEEWVANNLAGVYVSIYYLSRIVGIFVVLFGISILRKIVRDMKT